MEQISGFKIVRQSDSITTRLILKDKRNIRNITITASAATIFVLMPEITTFLLYIGSALNIMQIIKFIIERKNEGSAILCELLRNTETYKECKKEYDEVIKDIADLIRKKEINSSKEVCTFVGNLIKNGHVSVNETNQYHDYKYQNEYYLPEILGAKVLSGKCVCRHYAAFVTDILTELGYAACNVAVKGCSNNKPVLSLRMKPFQNHAVVGIYENGQKYLYDPTVNCFGASAESIPESIPEKNRIAQIVSPEYEGYYLMIKPEQILNLNKDDLQLRIHKAPLINMTDRECDILNAKAHFYLKIPYNNLEEFKRKNKERIKRITELYQELMPSSDKPIKKWLIRK